MFCSVSDLALYIFMYAYNYFYFWRVYWRHHDPLNNSRHVSWKQECPLHHSAVIKIRKCDFVTIQCLTLSWCSYFISFSSNILKAIFPLLLIQTRSVLCIYLSCLLNALQSRMCVSALLHFPEQALCSDFCRRSSSFNLHSLDGVQALSLGRCTHCCAFLPAS